VSSLARPLAWLLALVASAAPWAFGAVDPSWTALLTIGCLVPAGLALLLDAFSRNPPPVPRGTSAALVALVAVPLLGTIPLPGAVRSFLAPGGTALLAETDPSTRDAWIPVSFDPAATQAALGLAAAYAGAFLLLAREAARPSGRQVVTALLSLSGVALAIFGVLQHAAHAGDPDPRIYGIVPIYEVGTPYGPYVNRTHFAGAMALFACIAAGECAALWAEARRAAAIPYAAAAVVTLGALAATTARGGVLGVGAAALFVLATVPSGRRVRVTIVIALLAAAGAGILVATGALDAFLARIGTVYGRWTYRFLVQRDAFSAFLGNPVAGTGAGSFNGAFAPWQRIHDERTFANAHSDWAQIVMETGLLGLGAVALAAGPFCAWVRGTLTPTATPTTTAVGTGSHRVTGAARWRVIGPAAGVVAIVAHGLVDVNLHVPANALLTVCALSLASAASLAGGPAPDGRSGAA
jgi:O-antigen ligase